MFSAASGLRRVSGCRPAGSLVAAESQQQGSALAAYQRGQSQGWPGPRRPRSPGTLVRAAWFAEPSGSSTWRSPF